MMTHNNGKSVLKSLAVDMMMLLIFALLLGFALWIVWMYFFRGPIDIETRGYVSKTLKEAVVQPTDIEKYTLQHFHNLNEVVLKGIEYPSTCVSCHGDYPHNKTAKVRAFFNAHSWFMACEVCHGEYGGQKNIVYKWLDNDTDIELYKLQGERGIYEARIVPYSINNKKQRRQDGIISEASMNEYNDIKDSLNKDDNKSAIENLHQVLIDKPVTCDQCHAENGMFEYKDVLYSANMAKHLKSLDVGAMIKGYEVFYFPSVLDPRNE